MGTRPDPSFYKNLARNLEQAYLLLSDRCLYESAKWTAEALNGLPELEDDAADDAMTEREPDSDSILIDVKSLDEMTPSESRSYLLAKACFDCREYDRAAQKLERVSTSSAKCIFLHLYARYISGEKKRDEQSEAILGPLDGDATVNKQLVPIINELESHFTRSPATKDDPFLLYLYGIVLVKHKCEKAAVEPLARSVKLYPYNWGAWQELSHCVSSIDQLPYVLARLPPTHVMTKLFEVATSQELFQSTESVFITLDQLETVFPNFVYLEIQRAMLCYHALEYDDSARLFDHVVKLDPHRLDDMDMYSNVLYVTEQRAKLAHLAQLASATDKFRPETCCIIANYYSLKSEHEKAVVYYRRALTLNRNCLGAWTLMGHEYMELKNARAAIESYRRALKVSSKDARAWYGLGQAYEVIEMYYYSFFYYQRAAALTPYDQRMWIALANCFDKLQRPTEAIKAYTRALSLSDSEPSILQKLIELYRQIGDKRNAERYAVLLKNSEVGAGEGGVGAKSEMGTRG
ncbi:anaphase promoting complex subunit 8 [Myxozyma melibiosi]|uniref:Anaphase promoting complex subunit 8 n=1 Tax=Myxozyma melibiosi TaxID=54550 RepID=A0ABR1F3R4_9ASCO